MSQFRTALAVALAAIVSVAAAQAAGLEAYRGKARPVVVFAPDHGDKRTIDQLDRLKPAALDLADRDMPVLVVTGSDVAVLAGTGHADRPDGGALRRAYGVAEGAFAVVLVGKDGGEKLKSDKPVDASRLISLVDAMPMRQDELKTGSSK